MKELVADHKSFDGLVKNITIFYRQNFFKVSSKEQHVKSSEVMITEYS